MYFDLCSQSLFLENVHHLNLAKGEDCMRLITLHHFFPSVFYNQLKKV